MKNITPEGLSSSKIILTFDKFIFSYNIKSKQLEQSAQWFPIRSSKELAEIAAALMTDGHIDWNNYDGCPRPKKIVLYSNYRSECQWFLDTVYKQFGVNGKIVKYISTTGFSKSTSYKAIVYNAPLARILISIGIPCGDKTQKSYLIPGWVIEGNIEVKKSFLRILFNFDGSISVKSKRASAEINFCFNKHSRFNETSMQFIQQIKSLLAEFDVPSGKIHVRQAIHKKYPNYDKNTFMLFISSHNGIINFYRQIGFLNEFKQERLESFIYRTYVNARFSFHFLPNLLIQLKDKFGTD